MEEDRPECPSLCCKFSTTVLFYGVGTIIMFLTLYIPNIDTSKSPSIDFARV